MKSFIFFKNAFFVFNFLVLVFFLSACEQKPVQRQYKEITLASPLENTSISSDPHPFLTAQRQRGAETDSTAPSMNMSDLPVSAKMDTQLLWNVPDQWKEQAGSGLRLATFTSPDGIECSLVSLGGMAGGLEANAVRWMEQINIPIPAAGDLKKFLEKQEQFQSRGNLPVILLDLTVLQTDAPSSAPSMIAGIVTVDDAKVFVKMIGSLEAVKSNREKLTAFCRSLKKK